MCRLLALGALSSFKICPSVVCATTDEYARGTKVQRPAVL